jgi:hypothetical protein
MALIAFVFLNLFTNLAFLTSFTLGIMTFFLIFILFDLIDLFLISRQLKKMEKQTVGGKCNLIVQNTSIEIIHPFEKRVIFISQLKKLTKINEVLYFIEKKSKNYPFKINKMEMSNGAFERLVAVMESKKIE